MISPRCARKSCHHAKRHHFGERYGVGGAITDSKCYLRKRDGTRCRCRAFLAKGKA